MEKSLGVKILNDIGENISDNCILISAEVGRLLNIYKKYGETYLICWCKEEMDDDTPCHGDVIKEILEKGI